MCHFLLFTDGPPHPTDPWSGMPPSSNSTNYPSSSMLHGHGGPTQGPPSTYPMNTHPRGPEPMVRKTENENGCITGVYCGLLLDGYLCGIIIY